MTEQPERNWRDKYHCVMDPDAERPTFTGQQRWRRRYWHWQQGHLNEIAEPDLIVSHLGFCHCGDPEMIDRLALTELRWCAAGFADRTDRDLASHLEACGGTEAHLLIACLLDMIGATEHGVSVYGAWLTEDGRGLLAALEDVYGSGEPN